MTTLETAAEESRRPDPMRRRRLFLFGIVGLVIVAGAGALLLTLTIKSPAQQAAETRPPGQTQLTAPVLRTVLSTTVLAQAVVGAPKEITPSTVGGGGGSSRQGVQQIVTKIFRHNGASVGQGSVILEVAGQPFFVLEGTVPAYRNLQPGESGEDIMQLQDDLAALGYGDGGDTPGVFGPGTSAAADAFYESIGYHAAQLSTGPKSGRGAMIPLGEYSFIPRLPARIVKLGASVGQAIKGGLTFAMGSPVIDGQLSPSDAQLVRPGMKVTITEPGTGVTVTGRVKSVSHATATKASISGGLYVRMSIKTRHGMPMSLVGQDVSVTITTAHSSGPVLAVPEAAIFASASGKTYVTKVVGGHLVRVPVRVGTSGSGLVQVIPVRPGSLGPGAQVLTGENYASGGSGIRSGGGTRGGSGGGGSISVTVP